MRRIHSGTEDGPLWYVVDATTGAVIGDGGWLDRDGAEAEAQWLYDGGIIGHGPMPEDC